MHVSSARLISASTVAACVLAVVFCVGACSEPSDSECPAGSSCGPACTVGDCQRGVCDGADGCVNADDCAGDDQQCLDGYTCGEDNTCQPDPPDRCADRPACPRGVCEPSAGTCVDAASCDQSTQCLAGKRCLGGQCTADSDLCGQSGCPDNQVCTYHEDTLSAECTEATPCQTSRDCFDGRVCAGRQCLSAPVCEYDDHEAIEADGDPIPFDQVAHHAAVDASLCADDTDIYQIALPGGADDPVARELRIAVDFPRREVGLGPIEARLRHPTGGRDIAATTDEDGHLELTYSITGNETRPFRLTVALASDQAPGGIHYRLAAEVQPVELGGVCQSAPVLEPGGTIAGGSADPATTLLRTRCDHRAGASTADVYAVDVDQPSQLDAVVHADRPRHFIVGLRRVCRRTDTEFACTNGAYAGLLGGQAMGLEDQIVEPGRYFVVVQHLKATPADSYELSVTTDPIACNPAENRCSSTNRARVCTRPDGQLDDRHCPRGCRPSTGRCRPTQADVCAEAPVVSANNTLQFNWGQLDDDYEIPEGRCLPLIGGSTQSDGPDAVYRIELDAHEALDARLAAADSRIASLYVLDDCLSAASSCALGSNADPQGDETLYYTNTTDQPRTVFLVADSAAKSNGLATIDIDIESVVCAPDDLRCSSSEVQECAPDRTRWNTVKECAWGCTDTTCNTGPGNTCPDAIALNDGDTFGAQWSDYTSSAPTKLGACDAAFPPDNQPREGPDAYFSVDLTAGDLLDASLDPADGSDLFVLDGCQGGPSRSCLHTNTRKSSVSFYASHTGTYYLGIETLDLNASGEFGVSVDIQSGVASCQPDSIQCNASSGQITACNDQGTAVKATYQCSQGCDPDGCLPQTPPNDTCDDALPISGGISMIDDLNRFSDDYRASTGCGPRFGDADAIYEVDMAADQILDASVQGSYNSQPGLYVLTQCGSRSSVCEQADSGSSDSAHLQYQSPSAQTVYLMVDQHGVPPDGRFLLDVDLRVPQCAPGQTSCGAAGALNYCTNYGLWESYECQGGCSATGCAMPAGGICADAIPVAAGQTVTGNWDGQNNCQPGGGEPGLCEYDGRRQWKLADTFYQIDLQAGDLLTTDLQTANPEATVTFLSSCTATDNCRPSSAPGGQYYADKAGPVWVMVDSAPTFNAGAYQLTFDVSSSGACAPGQSRCATDHSVQLCNADGTAVRAIYDCPAGCADGGCQVVPSSANTCQTAPNIGNGIFAYADAADLTDDVELDAQRCLDEFSDAGKHDLVYQVTVGPDEVLHARSGSAKMFVFEDCAAPSATCVDPDDPALTTSFLGILAESDHELFWTTDRTRTVNVVAEAQSGHRIMDVLIETLPNECTAGQRRCGTAGDARYCQSFGRWRHTDCVGACVGGRCTVPSGETCADPIELTPAASIAGDFDDFDNDFDGKNAILARSTAPDSVYEIDLAAGDLLTADLVGPPGAGLYIASDCSTLRPSSYLASSNHADTLEFFTPDAGAYYLIVEGSDLAATSDYVLQTEVRSGRVCQPNAAQCDPATNQAKVCNANGTGFRRTYSCVRGCNGNACAPPAAVNDTCSSAYAIGSDTILADSIDRFDDDYSNPSACSASGVHGADAVYEIFLDQYDVLRARARGSGSLLADDAAPDLFVVTACAQGAGSCLAHQSFDDPTGEVRYKAQSSGTVYLIVKPDSSSTKLDYELEINIAQAQCLLSADTCIDSDVLQSCVSGLYEQRVCPAACGGGGCYPPPNDVCGGATSIPRDGEFHTHQMYLSDDYTNAFDLSTQTSAACSTGRPGGSDAVYRLNATAGDVLTARWDPANGIAGWITDDCSQASAHCVAGAATNGVLTHTMSTNGPHWLVIDSESYDTSQPVTVDVRLAPTICQPGAASCQSSTGAISVCNETGTAHETYACAGGCSTTADGPRCGQPRGEQCVDAIDATGGGMFSVDLTGFADSVTLDGSAGSCTTVVDGRDAFYRVDLAAGDTVEATITPNQPGDWTFVYILDDCFASDPDAACKASNFGGRPQPVSTTYTATSDQTVWVVVDSPRDTPDSPMGLSITLR